MSPLPPRPSSRIPSSKAPSTPPPPTIEKAGGEALPLAVDVREEASVKAAIDETAAKFGGIDIVVNNASAISAHPGRGDRHEPLRPDDGHQRARHLHGVEIRPALSRQGRQPAHPDAVAAARHADQMVRAAHRLFDGEIRHEPGGAGACRRAARQDRGQRAVAAHHHRHRRDQEPARRRRHHAHVAQAGDPGGGRLPHLPQAEELHRQLPDRRHVPRRRRRHRLRPIPRRSEPAAAGGFLRAGRYAAAP